MSVVIARARFNVTPNTL